MSEIEDDVVIALTKIFSSDACLSSRNSYSCFRIDEGFDDKGTDSARCASYEYGLCHE